MVDTSVRNVAAAKLYAVINSTNDPSIATHFARRSVLITAKGKDKLNKLLSNPDFKRLRPPRTIQNYDGPDRITFSKDSSRTTSTCWLRTSTPINSP